MRSLFCVAAGALLLKTFLALFTVGTNDALTWEHDLDKLRAAGFTQLYREGVQYSSPSGTAYPRQDFIHPAAMVHGLRGLGMLQDVSGLPLRFYLRLICAFADIGTLVTVWMILGRPHDGCLLKLLTLSPISILVSGFHANTDPIMIFFVVLGVYFVERGRVGWAGVAFGTAASIKLVPMILVPAILMYLPSLRERVKWGCIGAGTWIVLSMPYLALEPILILKTIFGYESARGTWGFYLFVSLLKDTPLDFLNRFYAPLAKWIAFGACAALPLVMKLVRVTPPLFVQCGMIVFAFLFLSPGFALQYLAWTVPWIVVLGPETMAAYYAISGVCLLAAYTAATGGTVINAYADTFNVTIGMRLFTRFVLWLSIGVMVWLYGRFVNAACFQSSRTSLRQPS